MQSTSKGILIPRMTTAQRDSISNPKTGLMVFDHVLLSFYFYNGGTWEQVGADDLGKTRLLQNLDLANNDIIAPLHGVIAIQIN